jgi:hypothetical protein
VDGTAGDSRLQAGSYDAAAQHCSICHWLRSLRVFQSDAVQPLPRPVSSARAVARPASPLRRMALSALPARAPPA